MFISLCSSYTKYPKTHVMEANPDIAGIGVRIKLYLHLEHFIWYTMDEKAKVWGYGQISAIILSGPPAMVLLRIFAGSLKEFDLQKNGLWTTKE
ncbi:Protein of unknown function [Pyronema omphalodes CBS 100304]|uniref:Uncharacterized protein n=1 Tax=Pyronema omphalodes (strain CBS 100304) TaxID=1076935 RepID=U4LT08_PYROM|nr:Protein of unknown function [Pyronema omphalodes CBS 100304]